MSHRFVNSVLFIAGLLVAFALASCEEDLGADHCEDPGTSAKCTCPGGRESVRTCDAFNTLGACYCNTSGCGNGEVEPGEQCDDGNLDNGDGCDENCLSENPQNGPGQGPQQGPGPGPGQGGGPAGPGPGGMGGAPMGGMGGVGGLGGMPIVGGMGGAPMGGMGGLGGN